MLSETALGAYFWGIYIWFVVGFLLVAIPAIIEVGKMFLKRTNTQDPSAGSS